MTKLMLLAVSATLLVGCATLPQTGPLAQPTPTMTQHIFQGEGATVKGPLDLKAGALYVAYRHEGEHFWAVHLKDPSGDTVAFITTDIGPAEGSTMERVYHTGSYFLEIEAQEGAEWAIVLGQ